MLPLHWSRVLRVVLSFLAVVSIAGWAHAASGEIRMLIPGFTVEELPVRIPNINNLRFAPDGALTALGYNGKVWKLRDTDGDGLEDQVAVWWDKAPLTVPVGMCWSTHGLFVSSSGKVSLLRDSDGNDVADTEEVVASGWPGKDTASGNVDASGVTMDAEGNLYFALLTANYANPYRLKKVGDLTTNERDWLRQVGRSLPDNPEAEVSLYDPDGVRGSVQKWNATSRELETIATGVRVPYNFAFNRAGDLFMTDQEGETWCPNGNPLDELNHIVRGRNYGFPPRHSTWLPELRSLDPVVSFGPQHQSTCGFVFNEPHAALNAVVHDAALSGTARPAASSQGLFGPSWWEGDAFVAGESRGKLWRVRMVKTSLGYVGKETLIARLSMMPTDVAISPAGDLYVSCHSGLPDWGTGPNGEGKIFRIRHSDPAVPQPVSIQGGGRTVLVTFDRPIDPSVTNRMAGVGIEYGDFVRAGDRFESLKPPYAVVKLQDATPRRTLKIREAKLIQDDGHGGRTLVLNTEEPHPYSGYYAVRIPGVKEVGKAGGGVVVDLDYARSDGALAPPLDWVAGMSPAELTDDEALRHAPPTAPHLAASTHTPLRSGNEATIEPGDYETGRALFFGDALKCGTCHRIRGQGAGHGPDLSNLVSRDRASVLRDIIEPGAAINPDYIGYNLTLNDDTELSGFVRHQGNNRLKVTAATGEEEVVRPTQVREMRPAGVSLMPEGLLATLDATRVNDLLTFLQHAPPRRTLDQVRGFMKAGENSPTKEVRNTVSRTSPVRAVLVASKQDHGPGQHDYPAWQKAWHTLLEQAPRLEVEDAWLWPSQAQFEHADVMVFYYWNRDWNEAKYRQLDAYQARGGGVVVLHSSTIEDHHPEKLAQRIGLAATPSTVQYRHTPFDLKIISPRHEITRGLPEIIRMLDEPYWPMVGDVTSVQVLAVAVGMDGEDRPMMWTYEKGKGRVWGSIAGHYTWTLDDPLFRLIMLRGIAWSAGLPAETFESALTTQPR